MHSAYSRQALFPFQKPRKPSSSARHGGRGAGKRQPSSSSSSKRERASGDPRMMHSSSLEDPAAAAGTTKLHTGQKALGRSSSRFPPRASKDDRFTTVLPSVSIPSVGLEMSQLSQLTMSQDTESLGSTHSLSKNRDSTLHKPAAYPQPTYRGAYSTGGQALDEASIPSGNNRSHSSSLVSLAPSVNSQPRTPIPSYMKLLVTPRRPQQLMRRRLPAFSSASLAPIQQQTFSSSRSSNVSVSGPTALSTGLAKDRSSSSGSISGSSLQPNVSIQQTEQIVKTLVKTELEAQLSVHLEEKESSLAEKFKQLQEKQDMLNQQLTDASDEHAERVRQLGTQSQELDSKASKISGMIKTAESAVIKVSSVAETAISSIQKAREGLVESALPFLKNPVSKMVQAFLGELRSQETAPSAPSTPLLLTSPTPTTTYISSSGEETSSEQGTSQNKAKRKRSASRKTNKCTKKPGQELDSSTDSTENMPASKRSRSSTERASKNRKNRSPFKPLQVVEISSTKKRSAKDILCSSETKKSCVTPCEKGSLYEMDFSQHLSIALSPPPSKKSSVPPQPKRGRAKKSRAAFGGGRRKMGLLNDIDAFL